MSGRVYTRGALRGHEQARNSLARHVSSSAIAMRFERVDDDATTALVLVLLVVLVGAFCSYLHARKPRCVVVADDFGISMERSRGIIRALNSGVVTNTSVMANGDAAVEGRAGARPVGDGGNEPWAGVHRTLGGPLEGTP